MPLKLQDGVRIWPPPQPTASPFTIPINEPIPQPLNQPMPNFEPQPHSLPVPLFIQERRNWCWAACVQMVMHFFERPIMQCEIASLFFNSDSCADPGNFDIGCEPGEVQGIFAIQVPRVNCQHHVGTVEFDFIQDEIDQRQRPVGVALLWFNLNGEQRGGHIVLVKGWRILGGTPFVKVNDPWYGPGDLTFARLKSYYGPDDDDLNGVWSHTWINIRR